MSDYLINHAIDHVWCSPRQDRQYINKPKRLSKASGEVVQMEDAMVTVWLPNNKDYFHVYQIGQLHPDYLGLFPIQSQWVSLSDVSNQMNMTAEVYIESGVIWPRYDCWYMVTAARNLIIAVRKNNRMGVAFNSLSVFFRVYTNAFWQSQRSNGYTEFTHTEGKAVGSVQEILSLQTTFNQYKAKPGFVYALINGYYSEEISPITCKVGDNVELIYDASVYRVVEFEIKDLPLFDSILDNKGKYLLHYPLPTMRIDYQDDIDLWLVQRVPGKKANGLYVHKNNEATLRMVTHKDYSVAVQHIQAFVDGHPTWVNADSLKLQLVIRNAGFDRSLTYEANRIHELYKLPEEDIAWAMSSENETVPVWRAAHLEKSAYAKLMGTRAKSITRELVEEAYGYNYMSVIFGNTPMIPYDHEGSWSVDVPRGLYENATAYEYDSDGLLLGWYQHPQGTEYVCANAGCAYVEMIKGKAEHFLDEVYDQVQTPLSDTLNYRMYTQSKVGGVATGPWTDVTGSAKYTIVNGTLNWGIDFNKYRTLVRSDRNVLGYIQLINANKGVLEFDLTTYLPDGEGWSIGTMDVPMGELQLWLWSHPLIENVDYRVEFPKVVIYNKEFLVDPETRLQEVGVRFAGFCHADLSHGLPEDVGFVKYDLLSRNSIFNLRDDRVVQVVVGGRIYDRSELKFSESDQAYKLPHPRNGKPYSIRDLIVPMREFTGEDTYAMREASRLVDADVSAFLTDRLPEPSVEEPNVIAERYVIYSPFLNRVLFALIDNEIDRTLIQDQYEPSQVKSLCEPYEYLLAFDPTQANNRPDEDYVIIHPHYRNTYVEVDIYHYKFMEMVISLYMPELRNTIQFSHFVQLKDIPV